MKSNFYAFTRVPTLFTLFLFFVSLGAFAQTPGLIYKPATGSGAKVLDPNGDGYVSASQAGFSGTTDEGSGISELPYRPFPALSTEPIADLNTGSSGGHTDLATPTPGDFFTGSPISGYFDGTNFLFRIRIGKASTASKGYSVLIDSDGVFNGSGVNPGFEYEVLLASNFAVQIIKHTSSGISTIFTGSIDQYSQRSVAASNSGGNPDYFYDFYVPLSGFNGEITASTPLRMSGITITSAQSGITGTVSDVGGVNFKDYNYDAPSAWRALINAFPATSMSTLQNSAFPPVAATAPRVNGPILANSTSISGTSVEAAGSTITVLRSVSGGTATSIGTTTVAADGTWTLSGLSSTLLAAGNVITATVQASGKSVSASSNAVTVSAGLCTSVPPPIITGLGGSGNKNRSFIGTTSYTGNQRITIHGAGDDAIIGSFNFNSSTSGNTWTSPLYAIGDLSYYATVTPLNSSNEAIGCESMRSNQICFRNGNPSQNDQTITITGVTYNGVTHTSATSSTWNEVPTTISSISGTVGAPPANIASGTQGYVTLYVNAVEQSSTLLSTSATTWTISTGSLTLKAGDVVNVRTLWTVSGGGQSQCPVPSTRSNLLRVQSTSAAPTINAPSCGLVTRLSGTSTEIAGSVIQFYTGGTAGTRDGAIVNANGTSTPITATVGSNGTWVADFSGATGGGIAAGTNIVARAKASGKVRSVNSNVVQSTVGPSGTLTLSSPIQEGATSVSGTGPANSYGAKVTLYIDGTPFSTPVLVANDGSWTVSGIAAQELYAGASVTATFKPTDQCESQKATAVIVSCKAPVANYTLTLANSTICGGNTASVTLSGSEYGITYRLLVDGVESGSSVVGNGSAITLVSGVITNTTASNTTRTFTFRARKISGTTCDATSTNTASLTVRPQPLTSSLSFTSITKSVCAKGSTTFALNGTSTSYNYQLVNEATNQLVGTAVQGVSSGSINLATGQVNSNTTFGLRVTVRPADANACSITQASAVSVTISSPSVTRAVYASASKVCAGGATNINVSTENNSEYTYTVRRKMSADFAPSTDPVIGAPFTGNGSIRSVATGALSSGTYTYYVTVQRSGSSCGELIMTNTAQVEASNTATVANAGTNRVICGSTVVLQANDPVPGVGAWSQVSGPSTASFSSANNPNATAQNLVSGEYVFRWTITTNCSGTTTSTSDVTIRVNCDANYTIEVPKYKDEYLAGDVLAAATDPDGTITAAVLDKGSLSPGMAMNTSTGRITVSNPAALTQGTYPITVKLTDQFGYNTFSNIVLRVYGNSPAITPLPVELVYFKAVASSGQVQLHWLTASEENSKAFVIERSPDGATFKAIGTKAGAGTTRQQQQYRFTDPTPADGENYYRLKQVDLDGRHSYSKVVYVNLNQAQPELQVWPNPFSQHVKVVVTAPFAEKVAISILSLDGQQVYLKQATLQAGANELELQLAKLPAGLYILRLQGNQLQAAVKVVKR